jgi:hypothetical protein
LGDLLLVDRKPPLLGVVRLQGDLHSLILPHPMTGRGAERQRVC